MANPRVRKRDRIRHMTRRQIEKLLAKGKKTWMSINTVLKDGGWQDSEEED